MTKLCIIFHAGADDLVDRHLPFWERAVGAENVHLFCGRDQLWRSRHRARATAAGESQHYGPLAVIRFLTVFKLASKLAKDDAVIVAEADAVLFRPPPDHPCDGSMISPLFRNTEPHRFQGEFYAHPIHYAQPGTMRQIAALGPGIQPPGFNEPR